MLNYVMEDALRRRHNAKLCNGRCTEETSQC